LGKGIASVVLGRKRKMEIRREGVTLFLDDAITERLPVEHLVESIVGVQREHGKVVIDLAGVKRANSSGIMRFAATLRSAKGKIILARCPVWMVEQFNSTSEFFLEDLSVTSVFAPYLNSLDGSLAVFLVGIDKAFFQTDRFKNVAARSDEAGVSWTADFDPEEYFGFVDLLKG
jgi:ABC-type transporter Mla MlaB component